PAPEAPAPDPLGGPASGDLFASPPPQGPPPSKLPKVIGGILLLGLAAAALWHFVLSDMMDASVGEYAVYMPEGSVLVAYADVDRFRQSDLYERFKGPIQEFQEKTGSAMRKLKLRFEDIQAVFAAGADERSSIAVIRTVADKEPGDLFAGVETDQEHAGFRYGATTIGRTRTYIAKTAPSTFCVSENEAVLKDTLTRLSKKAPIAPDARMAKLLGRVARYDAYVAISDLAKVKKSGLPAQVPMPGPMGALDADAIGVGISVGSSIHAEAALSFASAEKAEAQQKMIDSVRTLATTQMKTTVDQLRGPQRDLVKAELDILDSMSVSRSGSLLKIKLRADVNTLFDAMNQAAGAAR
ncbi:hypothetical protein HQ576_14240, partial [bacterium]|nr:hypothetical protein [bacterium]